MITPGFFNYFNAHRSLLTAQAGMNVVNHNVANANTPNYTKQRIDVRSETPFSLPTTSGSAGTYLQIGQGSVVDRITRVRDGFLDAQYRQENSTFGESEFAAGVLKQIEGILAEPSDAGINTALQNFFEAAQALSIHPESIAARADFLQQSIDMTTVFQQQGVQLKNLRTNLVGDPLTAGSVGGSVLNTMIEDVNGYLGVIAGLNDQINTVTSAGGQPNDLLDRRDSILEKLTKLIDVSITELPNSQVQLTVAGNVVVRGPEQYGTFQVIANPNAAPAPTNDPAVVTYTPDGGAAVQVSANINSGEIRGVLDMGSNNPNISTLRGVLEDLNTLFVTLTDAINVRQVGGFDLNGNNPPPALFTGAGADLELFHRTVNTVIVQDPTQLAAAINDPTATGPPAGFAGVGDGRNALAIAQLRNQLFGAPMNSTPEGFVNTIVSRVGIDSRAYTQRTESQSSLLDALDLQRQAKSGVNMDEEMIDLMRFQRQFEASSKFMRAIDEAMQTVINMV